ncbi:MAG: HesA/MoeB/ThiF family protein [Firmicutes bacterium]|nr:HesA/MoeB/ThiF family protein [Bacillota bacterium]
MAGERNFDEIFARNMLVPAIGRAGQEKLLAARVLVVGAGGLGSPVSLYLAAAGVGVIGLADADVVERSNLQRQILYGLGDTGRKKTDAARERLESLNGRTRVEVHPLRLDEKNAAALVRDYDLVVDCTDSIAARYVLNEACFLLKKPLVHGGVLGMAGQLMTVLPGRSACFRCAFPDPALAAAADGAAVFGVLGAVAGVVGSLQACEAVKIILGRTNNLLTDRILLIDCLRLRMRAAPVARRPDCPACAC